MAFLAEYDSGVSVNFHAFGNLKHQNHLNHSSRFILYVLKGCEAVSVVSGSSVKVFLWGVKAMREQRKANGSVASRAS